VGVSGPGPALRSDPRFSRLGPLGLRSQITRRRKIGPRFIAGLCDGGVAARRVFFQPPNGGVTPLATRRKPVDSRFVWIGKPQRGGTLASIKCLAHKTGPHPALSRLVGVPPLRPKLPARTQTEWERVLCLVGVPGPALRSDPGCKLSRPVGPPEGKKLPVFPLLRSQMS
jgi:hypothetical protein